MAKPDLLIWLELAHTLESFDALLLFLESLLEGL
jgi:hypothetical protein